MIVHRMQQGSPEWRKARAGVITSSNFKLRHKAKAGANKGNWSEAARNYAFGRAIERISGEALDADEFEFKVWQADRGNAYEAVARRLLEARYGFMVEEVGFVSTDDGYFGASPDGLIDDDKGNEIKCFLAPSKLRPILLESDTEDVIDQCQGNMWLTGRKVWYFALYCPALASIGQDLNVIEVKRDDDYINAMELDLLALNKLVMEYESQLRARKAAMPATAAEAA
jgi:hypothetical protein